MKYFHGKNKKRSYYEGWYFKQTRKGELLAFIPGISIDKKGSKKAFIQIVSTDGSYQAEFDYKDTYISENSLFIRMGENEFSKHGLKVNINKAKSLDPDKQSNELFQCHGKLYYTHLTPLQSDIMGPFRWIPFMECNHGVISMRHRVTGSITLDKKQFMFYDNMGYIEKDWGTSFPNKYFWLQCNDFATGNASIMISVAEIPFLGTKFTGCICSVYLNGKEYRLATYNKVKIRKLSNNQILVQQGDLILEISLQPSDEHTLFAPDRGNMIRKINETTLGTASFRFQAEGKILFEETSKNVSYEWVNMEYQNKQ